MCYETSEQTVWNCARHEYCRERLTYRVEWMEQLQHWRWFLVSEEVLGAA